jgi:thymidylate synthase (FAD)
MIDSKKISIMDARYILPRCLSTFYYMRMNLKDTIAFIKQRMDKQIQPETDNIIAYKMYMELMKVYPYATGLIDIHAPSAFYVKMARTGQATNLYQPDADSDTFEWNEKDFIYQCKRDEMNGTDEETSNHFNELLKEYEELLKTIEEENRRWMPHLFC